MALSTETLASDLNRVVDMTDQEIERIKYLSVEVLKKDPIKAPDLTRELDALLDKQEAEEADEAKPSGCE